MVTIYDVASAARVSPATVSRVLNANADVSPELAERVRAAVAHLGYRPNSVARSLRRRATMVWGLIISDIDNPFFTSMVRGVEDVGQASGYSVVLCNADEDLAKEARYVDVVLDEQMAGVVISPASEDETDLRPLLRRNVPVVAIDRRLSRPPVDTVLVDNRLGAEEATTHLLEAGFRRVACLTGPQRTTTGFERLEGYRRALRKANVPENQAYVRFANFKEDGGYEATKSLMTSDPPPDSIFVTNNLMTLGTLEALRDLGLDVPGDVALVSFDELPWARLISPRLTTVRQPTYDMGREAARLLLARLQGETSAARQIVLAPSLSIRESSAAPTAGTGGSPAITPRR